MRIGDKGPDVVAWQNALLARGHVVVIDGDFGPKTHNATLAFQSAHGLPTTGVVGMNELQVAAAPIGSSVRPPPMLPHSIPFVEARHYLKKARAAVDNIVLHSMEAPEAASTAERCAVYFAATDKAASAHYCIDSDSVVQCVPDHYVAYHAPGVNHNGLGIEHAGYARQTRLEWLDAFGTRMLGLSVQLAAKLCVQWKIPPVYVSAAGLQLRQRGITMHRDVSAAFGKSDHTDPGAGFPIAWYVERVAALVVAQQAPR